MRTLYSNPNKWGKEQSFFETFRSARTDLHIQNPRRGKPPEPDYLFSISQKTIGLEVTSPVKESLAPPRTDQDKCLKKASQIAEQVGLETVEVKVQFRSDHDPIDIDKAAEELVQFVKKEIPKIDDTKSWHYYESGLKYIKWISIHLGTVNGHTWLPNHRFERIHMNWMERDPIDRIQSLIDKKQSKYHDYIQSCDECWLLIGVNEWTAPEAIAITSETKNHVFSGAFQRLFFLRNIEGSVVELKISSPI
ncbi:MAG: hypothetical protein ABIK32_04410 [Chloroflexota bacterium]